VKRLILKSPAKLNLFLKILRKRPDGRHNLQSLIERIDLCDRVELIRRLDGKIKIYCDYPGVPQDKNNLAYKAAQLLKKRFFLKEGVEIKINKRIPPACGLGGGASNAAMVLLGLNRLWHLGLEKKDLARYAAQIGSDVPFFIYEAPFAYADLRGERVKPVKIKKKFWHILVLPETQISTRRAYTLWDKKKCANLLTKKNQNVKIITLALKRKNLHLLSSALFNSFQSIAEGIAGDIPRIRDKLEKLGIKAISISGKGPAVFGIVTSRKEAERAKRLCSQYLTFVVKTF